MSNQEIIHFWGRANLRRCSKTVVDELVIPSESKIFMAEVGLPYKEKTWTLRFDSEAETLPSILHKEKLRRIGFDDFVPICLDEGHKGHVVAVDPSTGAQAMFINSSVQQFGKFLVYYQLHRLRAMRGFMSKSEIMRSVRPVEKEMRNTDPCAFQDPEDFWPGIIQQMYHGLL